MKIRYKFRTFIAEKGDWITATPLHPFFHLSYKNDEDKKLVAHRYEGVVNEYLYVKRKSGKLEKQSSTLDPNCWQVVPPNQPEKYIYYDEDPL